MSQVICNYTIVNDSGSASSTPIFAIFVHFEFDSVLSYNWKKAVNFSFLRLNSSDLALALRRWIHIPSGSVELITPELRFINPNDFNLIMIS